MNKKVLERLDRADAWLAEFRANETPHSLDCAIAALRLAHEAYWEVKSPHASPTLRPGLNMPTQDAGNV